MILAGHKLPMDTRFVAREEAATGQEVEANDEA
jgi:hypothetical protein